MADKDLWITFEKSGSIVDYLNYRGIYNCESAVHEKKDLGENVVESKGHSNRDDIVRNTYR